MDRVKEQSIHQFHKTFSSSISKFLPCNEEKAVEKRLKKKNAYCKMAMLFDRIALWYSLLDDFYM